MGIVLAFATGKAPDNGVSREGANNEENLSQKTGLKVDAKRLDRRFFFPDKGNTMEKKTVVIQFERDLRAHQRNGFFGADACPAPEFQAFKLRAIPLPGVAF